MKISILLISLLLFTDQLFAQTIHSSLSSYLENKTFKNSVQKEDALVYGVGADIHYNGSEYKLTYEQGKTNTKQPPLKEDLEVKKLFLRYEYNFDKEFALNVNYIGILKDNLAPTDGGVGFAGGFTYTFNRKTSLNFTQFYTEYDDFDIFQSDLNIYYKTHINNVKIELNSDTKFISVEDDEAKGTYTNNAQSTYWTSGVKLHAHYNSYHFGSAIYFGKRAFAIMDNGFKIQHHAMEFDRSYALGVGKNFYDFVVRAQYIYQRAIELPVNRDKHIEVTNFRLIINYKL